MLCDTRTETTTKKSEIKFGFRTFKCLQEELRLFFVHSRRHWRWNQLQILWILLMDALNRNDGGKTNMFRARRTNRCLHRKNQNVCATVNPIDVCDACKSIVRLTACNENYSLQHFYPANHFDSFTFTRIYVVSMSCENEKPNTQFSFRSTLYKIWRKKIKNKNYKIKKMPIGKRSRSHSCYAIEW